MERLHWLRLRSNMTPAQLGWLQLRTKWINLAILCLMKCNSSGLFFLLWWGACGINQWLIPWREKSDWLFVKVGHDLALMWWNACSDFVHTTALYTHIKHVCFHCLSFWSWVWHLIINNGVYLLTDGGYITHLSPSFQKQLHVHCHWHSILHTSYSIPMYISWMGFRGNEAEAMCGY